MAARCPHPVVIFAPYESPWYSMMALPVTVITAAARSAQRRARPAAPSGVRELGIGTISCTVLGTMPPCAPRRGTTEGYQPRADGENFELMHSARFVVLPRTARTSATPVATLRNLIRFHPSHDPLRARVTNRPRPLSLLPRRLQKAVSLAVHSYSSSTGSRRRRFTSSGQPSRWTTRPRCRSAGGSAFRLCGVRRGGGRAEQSAGRFLGWARAAVGAATLRSAAACKPHSSAAQ